MQANRIIKLNIYLIIVDNININMYYFRKKGRKSLFLGSSISLHK